MGQREELKLSIRAGAGARFENQGFISPSDPTSLNFRKKMGKIS